ncbi:IS5 family transposase [Azospirillum formosense]|uniref:IS5 family transposase n=1 Tax=Azospirillum formosense TaxID=861533 RepID=A0ABX2KZ70_9PROT|nr:IS5 family transposase [Azospirillum formosense]MBY3757579.1 IS5 family transposase [Azospirillum formosense]NUB19505.1 IS5 family transposase [Azospirillum formosense]
MLTDAMWRRLLPLLPPQKPRTGRPSLDHRYFLEAVLWLARTGAPWRDLPVDVMNWRTAWRRLQRWTAAGIWGRIVAELRAMAPNAGWDAHLLDSSVIRAHAHAAGARHKSGEQALGRSRGGFSTKLHLRADAEGRPVALHLTGGERHDLLGVGPLFEQGALRSGKRGRPRWKPDAVIADKAYSAAWLLDVLRRKRIVPIIPSRADQPRNPDLDRAAYRRRNLVERLVGKLKQFRRVATRYDKLDAHYLAFVQIASVMVWLRSFGDKT